MRVAVGSEFYEFGGIYRHILAIKKFSSHKVVNIPSGFARGVLGKNERRMSLYKRCIRKIGLGRYDVLHSHVDPWFTNLCMLSRASIRKWVHSYHTLYFQEDYPDGLKAWQKEINRTLIETASKADVKISASKWLHNYLLDKYSIETEVVPNGADIESCSRADASRFVKKYGLSDFILFVGYASWVKNPRLFIELAMKMPEINFVMIISNLNKSNIIQEYKVSIPRNLILMDNMGHEEVLDAMAACRVFVMTSKREGLPTVLLEAMGIGKVVVAPAHYGCKEVVDSQEYGFLYEPGSLEDLIEKVKKALVSGHIGNRAREMVLRNYDWKILAKKIDSKYESI